MSVLFFTKSASRFRRSLTCIRAQAFGFLPGNEVQNDPTASVNAGLQDQRLALRWVKNNIAAFGGDPNRVTAFGESSGAISIAFQMIANDGDVEDLFHAAILQSGAVSSPSFISPALLGSPR